MRELPCTPCIFDRWFTGLIMLTPHVNQKGGHRGFNRVIWTVKEYVPGGDFPYITLYYHSFDREQGENQCEPI